MFHAKRRNNRGVQTFRRVVWEKEWPFPVCDCNMHTSSGVPCVHVLLVLLNEGLPLFDRHMFHRHWTRRTSVRLAPMLETEPFEVFSCSSTSTELQQLPPLPESVSEPEHMPAQIIWKYLHPTHTTCNQTLQTVIPPNLPRPSDKVTTGKLMSITRSLIDLVTRPAAKKRGLDQKLFDTLKRIRTQILGSEGDNEGDDDVDFEDLDQSTTRTLFHPSANVPLHAVSEPARCGGAPQVVRKRKSHEPEPLSLSMSKAQLGDPMYMHVSQVSGVATSKSRHPMKKDTLCRFCGAAGCSRRRCPKIRRFGSRCISGQQYLNTLNQLSSTPALFENLAVLEQKVPQMPLIVVHDNWKTGKDFRHVVLKSWLRSTTTGSEAEVFVLIGRVQKNLQVHGEGDSIVNARSLYEQYIKHKLARKSISKLIIVEGMYINGN